MLPARLHNLVIHGSSGVAVGIATKIPPHIWLCFHTETCKVATWPPSRPQHPS